MSDFWRTVKFDAQTVQPHSPHGQSVPGVAPDRFIKSSAEFVSGFVPPDYLVYGVLRRRFLYSFTASTGSGKTAVALTLSVAIAMGWPFAGHEVEQGRVLYFAGENPDDVRMRWILMASKLKFDPQSIPVSFIEGRFPISGALSRIKQEIETTGSLALVVVDTRTAYFYGDDDNSNAQMVAHARDLRNLISLPGGPCVVVSDHPIKNAGPDNLIPRGGSAYLNEVDGNLTAVTTNNVTEVHWQGKFRGPDFASIPFEIRRDVTADLMDAKGRLIPSVYAWPLTDDQRQTIEIQSRKDEQKLLEAVRDNPKASLSELAAACGWIEGGKPQKWKPQRIIRRLEKDKRIVRDGRELRLIQSMRP